MKSYILAILAIIPMILLAGSAHAIISTGYLHTQDYYAVSYDGEGDAIVRARLMLSNDNPQPIREITLEVPGRDIVFYNLLEESASGKTCAETGYQEVCAKYDQYYNCEVYTRKEMCERYTYGPNVMRLENVSEHAQSESSMLTIKLPVPIDEGGSAAITLVYRIPRVAHGVLGAYSFDFETIRDGSAKLIENVRVAVSVEDGYYLGDAGGQVEYRTDFFGVDAAKTSNARIAQDAGYYSDFSRQIVESTGYVKTASNLDPLESLAVSGQYSQSYIRVHLLGSAAIALGVVIMLFALAYSVHSIIRTTTTAASRQKQHKRSVIAVVVTTSLLQATSLSLLWFAVTYIMGHLNEWMPGSALFYSLAPALLILFGLLILAVFFLPPIFVGIREGILAGSMTLVLCVIWLLVLAALLVILASLLSSPPHIMPYPIY